MKKTVCALITVIYFFLFFPEKIQAVDLLSEINKIRQENHLQSLSPNPQLTAAAQAKANDMVAQNYWSHNSPSGETPWDFIRQSGYLYQSAGENLARGFDNTQAVEAWLKSPGHRRNILASKYTQTGFGYAVYYQNGQQIPLIVEMFASPKKSLAIRLF